MRAIGVSAIGKKWILSRPNLCRPTIDPKSLRLATISRNRGASRPAPSRRPRSLGRGFFIGGCQLRAESGLADSLVGDRLAGDLCVGYQREAAGFLAS